MRRLQSLLVICFIFASSGLFAQSDDTIRYQWDLTEIYASVEDWNRAMTEIAGRIEDLDNVVCPTTSLLFTSTTFHS